MSIIAMSDKPAQFNEVEILPTEVITIGDNPAAKVGVNLENAKSAVVYGLFEKIIDGITTQYLIESERGSVYSTSTNTTYIFTLPEEDGYWKLANIFATKVAYTDETTGKIKFHKDDPLAAIFNNPNEYEAVKIVPESEDAAKLEAANDSY